MLRQVNSPDQAQILEEWSCLSTDVALLDTTARQPLLSFLLIGVGAVLTFQTEKDWGSTTVGCTTSLPGNTPHVTAFTSV